MKQLPIGIQTFKEVITKGYVYVDKTVFLHRMITTGKYYFLARPRRFGKSMMVSTLRSIFSGERELFDGLAIATTGYEWQKYPVVILDMSSIEHHNALEFQEGLKEYLDEVGVSFSIDLTSKKQAGAKLRHLVKTLAKKGQPVVLLIDEYDKPITDYIHTPQIANEVRESLARFYGVIKSLDEQLEFFFLTGVSKFTKTSIFSNLNNLNDISMQINYAAVVGYTEAELRENFAERITELAAVLELSGEATVDKLRLWYNGYKFHENAKEKVFSPQTVMMAFTSNALKDYWFRTGTPSFLMKIVRKFDYALKDVEGSKISESSLDPGDVELLTLPAILFQTGYLTIKSYDSESKNYTLTYPNLEVMEGFLQYMVAEVSHKTSDDYRDLTKHLRNALAVKIAIEQIFSREYFTKFLNQKKKIIAIGLCFNPKKRNLETPWMICEHEPDERGCENGLLF